MKARFKIVLLTGIILTSIQYVSAQKSRFSTTYLLESDLYANQLKKEIDANSGSQAAYNDAVEIGKLLRHNAADLDEKIPVPMPPCAYSVLCGSNKIEGIVTKDLSYIDASIIDSNDNVVATLDVSPTFTDSTLGLKVYRFVWTHQVFGPVTINLTRPTLDKSTKQYTHKVVLQ